MMITKKFYYFPNFTRVFCQTLTGRHMLAARTAATTTAGCKTTITEKRTCRPVENTKPSYYKPPKPCKPSAELAVTPILGYPRCDATYNPHCVHKCFFTPRFDTKLYRPSKSLNRSYQVHWVDCVPVEKVRVGCSETLPPEVERRAKRVPYCPRAKVSPCFTVQPLECLPLVPAPTLSEGRCIKFPLCECPQVAKRLECVAQPKLGTCERLRTRYPSFSECQSVIRPPRVTECNQRGTLCEAWRVFQKRQMRKQRIRT